MPANNPKSTKPVSTTSSASTSPDESVLGKYLKGNIPQFQEDSKELNNFLDAAGRFLDHTKETIDKKAYIKDYHESDLSTVIERLEESGNSIPRSLPVDFRRKFLRDVADLNSRHGTEAALQYALSVIGVEPTYRNAWIIRPHLFNEGQYYDLLNNRVLPVPEDGELQRPHLIYGNEVSTEDGTYLWGADYFDYDFENAKLYPIRGEVYPPNEVVNLNNVVIKTPYLIVLFDGANFNINTGAYLDPVTGEVYEYTLREEAILIDEVIRYFTKGENRPTTLKILLVVLYEKEDEFSIVDESVEEVITNLNLVNQVYKDDTPVYKLDRSVICGGHWEEDNLGIGEYLYNNPCQIFAGESPIMVGSAITVVPECKMKLPDQEMEEEFGLVDEDLSLYVTNLGKLNPVRADEDGVFAGEFKVAVGGSMFRTWIDLDVDDFEYPDGNFALVQSDHNVVKVDNDIVATKLD